MARNSREESERTAARVLAAAAELFAAEGFAAVSLDRVAAAAGVTRGAIYHHFADKRGLFDAVAGRTHTAVAERVAAAAADSSDDWQALVVGCRAFLAAASDPAIGRVMLIDAPAVLGWERWLEQDRAASRQLLAEGLDALAAADRLATDRVEASAALLSGAMNDAALWIIEADDREAALSDACAALDVLLAGLRRN